MAYILGLDGASWQAYPDWPKLYDEGHRFMIWKVTGEQNYVNPTARLNLERAHNAGLVTGGYDWPEPQRAGVLPGKEAAEDFWRVCEAIGALRKGFLPSVDFETPEWHTGPLGRNIEPFMKPYMYRLKELAGCDLVPYSGPYFLEETGATHWDWLGRDFPHWWEAAPGKSGQLPDDTDWPPGYPPFGEPDFHQHQWYATSEAVAGNFDRDRYKYDTARLWALGYQGTPTPEPEEAEVQVPPEGKWSVEIMPNGNTVMILNFGGQTTPDGLVGAAIVDVGVTVKSATEEGVTVSRSFKDEQAQQWAEKRP